MHAQIHMHKHIHAHTLPMALKCHLISSCDDPYLVIDVIADDTCTCMSIVGSVFSKSNSLLGPFYLIWKLPSHAELAICVVCGFISDLSSKHCSATLYLHIIHG